jgi:two-component system chemotaxis response regulator CheB
LQRDIIVVGASAGGVEALRSFVSGLPADLPAAVFVTMHMPPERHSNLPVILARAGHLPVEHASDGEPIRLGRVHVASPDHHLVLERGITRVVHGPRENGHRPAIDVLFRTAARSYGNQVIAVVLSGSLADGASGIRAVRALNGRTIAQDPDEAMFSSMPFAAWETGAVDYVLRTAEMPEVIGALVAGDEPASRVPASLASLIPVAQGGESGAASGPEADGGDVGSATELLAQEGAVVSMDQAAHARRGRPGVPSGMACPDCGGVLWDLDDGEMLRFRCRVGHAYSAEALMASQSDTLEDALFTALRVLEEHADLLARTGHRAEDRHRHAAAARFAVQERDARDRADMIRRAIARGGARLEERPGTDTATSFAGAESGHAADPYRAASELAPEAGEPRQN